MPNRRFRDLPVRHKLILVGTLPILLALVGGGVFGEALLRRAVTNSIESQLQQATDSILNMVRASANASIRGYLRGVADSQLERVRTLHARHQQGELTEAQVRERACQEILSQRIGRHGYLLVMDSRGILQAHPQTELVGTCIREHAFVREQIRRKCGYLEYEWQNLDQNEPAAKAMYMTYFEPWDWIIAVTAYRDEFVDLVDFADLRERVLSLHFAETGYPYILTGEGDLVVHPVLENQNFRDVRDAAGHEFVASMCEQRTGRMIYPWKNPGETEARAKLVIFDYLPEFDWIVASSGYLDEIYAPLQSVRKVFLIGVAASLVLVVACSLWVGGLITRPLRRLIDHFRNGADGHYDARLEVTCDDEMGQLARYFNAFMSHLAREVAERKQAQATLQESNACLEMCVAERTAELAEAKEAAERADRSKSAFLANMSHEIRTPMTAILGFAETCLEADLAEHERTMALQAIERNGEHLLQILNDILDISKIEAGRFDVERTPCCPVELLSEVQGLMTGRAQRKGIPLTVDCEGPVPEMILTDPTRLRQILINLVGNAIKFTESGQVQVMLRAEPIAGEGVTREADVAFEVRDSGIGMTAEQIDRLFAPFVQADRTTSRRFGGTGLGLAVSRRLANLLNGDIAVESEPGRGSCFVVRLRVEVPDGSERFDSGLQPSVASVEGQAVRLGAIEADPAIDARILLAEDGPDNQRLFLHVLGRLGAEVEVVDDGRQAVERALDAVEQDRPFDIILMDMQMPVMDGYTATRTLRGRGYTGPIVALTAHTMKGDREKCLAAGCDDYLGKPIRRIEIVQILNRQLDRASCP